MKKLKIIIAIIIILAIVVGAIAYGVLHSQNENEEVTAQNENNTVVASSNNTSNNENVEEENNNTNTSTGRTLIVYYSLTNRTERVAEEIQKQTGGDLYRVQTVRTYPDVVSEVSAEAREERNSGNLPELQGELPNVQDYDLIIVGGPVWSSTVSTPLMSFLEQMDFQGKTVAPYWTDDGMPGHYETDFIEQAQNANVVDGIGLTDVSDMSDEQIENEIATWLSSVNQ